MQTFITEIDMSTQDVTVIISVSFKANAGLSDDWYRLKGIQSFIDALHNRSLYESELLSVTQLSEDEFLEGEEID